MLVGLCLGWGFGAAAMRAALAARDQLLLKQTLQQEAQRSVTFPHLSIFEKFIFSAVWRVSRILMLYSRSISTLR